MKFILICLAILIPSLSYADEHFPKGCKPMMIKKEKLMIETLQPTLIMLHNVSDGDIWVAHPTSETGGNALSSSRIQTNNWSALYLQDKAFELNCIESKPGHEQQVACGSVLAICEWEKMSNSSQHASITTWAAENMTLATLEDSLGRIGYVFDQAQL